MSDPQCPSCGQMSLQVFALGDARCQQCGAEFEGGKRRCPSCAALNDLQDEACLSCREPLTVFEAILTRQQSGMSSFRLDQMRGKAQEIKRESAQQSEIRMAHFTEIDRRRQAAEYEAVLRQHDRDRRLFRAVAIGLGAFLILITIVTLIVIL